MTDLLEETIKAWRRKQTAGVQFADLGATSCPLCRKYNSVVAKEVRRENSCDGCPIKEKTGQQHCKGTPYEAVVDLRRDALRSTRRLVKAEESGAWEKATQDMIDFLESLREKET